VSQPAAVQRMGRASFSWQGGPRGYDRPLDTAFVHVLRLVAGGWQEVTNDLGLEILWSVDNSGVYTARWQTPLDAVAGTYAFEITANSYKLRSAPFVVAAATNLTVTAAPAPAGHVAVALSYPPVVYNVDLTDRPASVSGGSVRFIVDGHPVDAQGTGAVFTVAAGINSTISVPAGGARDRYGNANGQVFDLRPVPQSAPGSGQP
jgi:hypothetical protein